MIDQGLQGEPEVYPRTHHSAPASCQEEVATEALAGLHKQVGESENENMATFGLFPQSRAGAEK